MASLLFSYYHYLYRLNVKLERVENIHETHFIVASCHVQTVDNYAFAGNFRDNLQFISNLVDSCKFNFFLKNNSQRNYEYVEKSTVQPQ